MPDVSMEYTISRCLQDNILTSPSYLKKKSDCVQITTDNVEQLVFHNIRH